MKKLLVQEFLENHTLQQLEDEHAVEVSFSKCGTKFSLNYNMISAKDTNLLANQCRGLILSAHDGRNLTSGVKDTRTICPGETVVQCYGFDRFFNYGQGAAAELNWSDPGLKVLSKLDGCFTYDTLLTCWDGSVVKIGEVVKNKLNKTLIGMDEFGNLVPCQITNWFNNGTKNNWLEITTSEIVRGKNRKFLVTSNHSIFINGKFLPAIEARIGDKLTTFENNICDWTKHFIRSSLLGDGTLIKNGANYKFEEGHKILHSEFSEQNKKWLGENFSWSGKYTSGFGSEMIRVSSRPDSIISELRKDWYNEKNIKILPLDLSWIDDFTIAKWYMDDGSLSHSDFQLDRACFATNNFTENEVIRLGEKLKEMYGISYTVYFSKGWCLRVNAGKNNEIDTMWRSISPYIVTCMRYKLPANYRQENFSYSEKSGKILKKKSDIEIVNIKEINIENFNNKKQFPHGRIGYDIETTTHNYVANNVLVHNSLTILYFDQFKSQWHVATRSVPEADLLIDGTQYTFRTLFEEGLKNVVANQFEWIFKLDKNLTYCFELTSYYNRIVCVYPQTSITLLGARNKQTLEEVPLDDIGIGSVPKVQSFDLKNIQDVLNWVSDQKPTEHEGVVIVDSKFNRIKVKNAAYVVYNKCRDSLIKSDRNCLEAVLLGQDDDLIPMMPQEIADKLTLYRQKLPGFIKQYDDTYNVFINMLDKDPPKKEFALLLQKSKVWQTPFFMRFDKKVKNMQEFIDHNKKNGTWTAQFLDRLLVEI